MSDEHDPISDADDLPEKLRADLGGLYRRRVELPASLDETVLRAARFRLKSRLGFRPRLIFGIGVAVAAATILLVWRLPVAPPKSALSQQFALGSAPSPQHPTNILDAYRLAHALKIGVKPSPDWDQTGDGVVDQKDVDALAKASVSLDLVAQNDQKAAQ
jgi:hypothetical protein